MPLQNRVLPQGEIVAIPEKGLFTGNRGVLHDETRTLRRRAAHPHWICCTLDWKGWRRDVMAPRRWTALFFLDEAVALSAGHRPCAYCRRPAFNAWSAAWARAFGAPAKAPVMDKRMQESRWDKAARAPRRFTAPLADLPDGTFIETPDGQAQLVLGPRLLPYSPAGYGPALPRPAKGEARVLTPDVTVRVLAAGFAPVLHPSSFS